VSADLTRNSFDSAKYFSRVLMQQGRVQLDADWNEQAAILLHLIRRLAADLGGPAWSPNGGFMPQSFSITAPIGTDLIIPEGSFYVDGILCEIEATPVAILDWGSPTTTGSTITVAQWTVDDASFAVNQYLQLNDDSGGVTEKQICQITAISYAKMQLTVSGADLSTLALSKIGRARRLVTYLNQPYWPAPKALAASTQLYIDVWERVITSFEDDSIREVALNGVDTAARTKVIWQIKSTPLSENNTQTCMTQAELKQIAEGWHRGVLRARVQPAAVSTDPCTISPTSSYQGAENQLYRVEIHTGGAIGAAPSFKWSRENGSVVFPVSAGASPGSAVITLTNLGRDGRFGLVEGDWVEPRDDQIELTNTVVSLLQVQSIDRSTLQVTLTGSLPASFGNDATLHPLLRRWDQQAGDPTAGGLALAGGAVLIPSAAGHWVDLEDGVQVLFDEVNEATYRSGDYWLIPARVATGNVIWPLEPGTGQQLVPVAKPPDGIDHHYAPLAIITSAGAAGAPPGIKLCDVRRAPG
jgi:hypothetical protein